MVSAGDEVEVPPGFLRSLWVRRERQRQPASKAMIDPVAAAGDAAARESSQTWQLTVIGCGDAFGSGGRLQTCFHLATADAHLLLDCGATALIGMNRLKLDPNAVDAVLVTHLHGDHFSGLVWWLMHAHYIAQRTRPLTVVGPRGLQERIRAVSEALFPGLAVPPQTYDLAYRDFAIDTPVHVAGLTVRPFEVRHPSGAPAFALRLEAGGRCLAFTGDTEWVENLVDCARGADLLIADCFGYDTDIGFHMSWKTIAAKMDRLQARQVLLSHMGGEMLARLGEIADPRVLAAEDGLMLSLGAAAAERVGSG